MKGQTQIWPHDYTVSPETEKRLYERLLDFNKTRAAGKARYFIQQPENSGQEYTLWRVIDGAAFKPEAYLGKLGKTLSKVVETAVFYLRLADAPISVVEKCTFKRDVNAEMLNFGKYKDTRIHDLLSKDPDYLVWLSKEQHKPGERKFNRILDTVRNYAAHYIETFFRLKGDKVKGRFIHTAGEKISDMALTVLNVVLTDDPYKTNYGKFYVDQVVMATDNQGNCYSFVERATTFSLESGKLSVYAHPYVPGERLHLVSARISAHFVHGGYRVNRLTYCKFNHKK